VLDRMGLNDSDKMDCFVVDADVGDVVGDADFGEVAAVVGVAVAVDVDVATRSSAPSPIGIASAVRSDGNIDIVAVG